MFIYTYIHTYIYICIYMYIFIYIERKDKKKRGPCSTIRVRSANLSVFIHSTQWLRPLSWVLYHFTGYARLVRGRCKCSPRASQLPRPEWCVIYFFCDLNLVINSTQSRWLGLLGFGCPRHGKTKLAEPLIEKSDCAWTNLSVVLKLQKVDRGRFAVFVRQRKTPATSVTWPWALLEYVGVEVSIWILKKLGFPACHSTRISLSAHESDMSHIR